jgi:hypothetical protein
MQDPNASAENLKVELGKAPEGAKVNLAQLLESLATQASQNNPSDSNDTPLLMKAAESMAIKFALDRYQRGEVKVNAVHDMMEHMSRQMDTLRQILRVQEDKMSKAGILVDSHADILDRMFWAEIPEAGKKSVLLLSATIMRSPPKFSPTTAPVSTLRMPIPAARPPSVWLNSATFTPPRPRKSCPMPSPCSARNWVRKAIQISRAC